MIIIGKRLIGEIVGQSGGGRGKEGKRHEQSHEPAKQERHSQIVPFPAGLTLIR